MIFGFNCGSGSVYIDSVTRVDDGRWHFAEFSRQGRNGKLLVDGDPKGESSARGTSKEIEIVDRFHVGGLPSEMLENTDIKRNLKVCICKLGNPIIAIRISV